MDANRAAFPYRLTAASYRSSTSFIKIKVATKNSNLVDYFSYFKAVFHEMRVTEKVL